VCLFSRSPLSCGSFAPRRTHRSTVLRPPRKPTLLHFSSQNVGLSCGEALPASSLEIPRKGVSWPGATRRFFCSWKSSVLQIVRNGCSGSQADLLRNGALVMAS